MKMFSGNREAKYLKWTSSNVFLEKFTPSFFTVLNLRRVPVGYLCKIYCNFQWSSVISNHFSAKEFHKKFLSFKYGTDPDKYLFFLQK